MLADGKHETNHNSLTIQTKTKKICIYAGHKQMNINEEACQKLRKWPQWKVP